LPALTFHRFLLAVLVSALAACVSADTEPAIEQASVEKPVALRDLLAAVRGDSPQAVQAILAQAPELARAAEGSGWTPLMRAVARENRDSDMVKLLLDYGADVNAKTPEGYTPLHMFFSVYAQVDATATNTIAQMLKDAGADLEARQHWDWTPLMAVAVEGGSLEFRALLKIGCDPYVRFTEKSLPAFTRGLSLAEVTLSNPIKVKALIDSGFRYSTDILHYGKKRIDEARARRRKGKTTEEDMNWYVEQLQESMALIKRAL
jgi:ankyrin repeat protein